MNKKTIDALKGLLEEVTPPTNGTLTVQSIVHRMLKILVGDNNSEGYNVEFTKLSLEDLIKAKGELIMDNDE